MGYYLLMPGSTKTLSASVLIHTMDFVLREIYYRVNGRLLDGSISLFRERVLISPAYQAELCD